MIYPQKEIKSIVKMATRNIQLRNIKTALYHKGEFSNFSLMNLIGNDL